MMIKVNIQRVCVFSKVFTLMQATICINPSAEYNVIIRLYFSLGDSKLSYDYENY
jgi:hypothetical protein